MVEGIKRVMNYCVNDAISKGITPKDFCEKTKTTAEVYTFIKEIVKIEEARIGIHGELSRLLDDLEKLLRTK